MHTLTSTDQDISNSPFVLEMDARLSKLADEALKDKIKSGAYSGPEIEAMKTFMKLELMNDYDLGGVILRWRIIQEIERKKLYTTHPGGYGDLEVALEIAGKLSRTQQSIIRGLNTVVFPYAKSELGMTPQRLWDDIGRSNLADVLPYLKVIITDEPSKRPSVNQVVMRIFEQVDEIGNFRNQQERKRFAVKRLLTAASTTNTELRKSLKGDDVDPVTIVFLHRDGQTFILASLTPEQTEVVYDKLKSQEIVHVDLSKEDLYRIPVFKQLMG